MSGLKSPHTKEVGIEKPAYQDAFFMLPNVVR